MRGRLIFPCYVELARIDYDATTMDPVWKTPVRTSGGRQDQTLVKVKAQCGAKETYEALSVGVSGNSPNSVYTVFFHFKDLESAGLVDAATGLPKINVNDRLVNLFDRWGNFVQAFRDPPGLYAHEVEPHGVGLGSKRNIFKVTFMSRAVSVAKHLEG